MVCMNACYNKTSIWAYSSNPSNTPVDKRGYGNDHCFPSGWTARVYISTFNLNNKVNLLKKKNNINFMVSGLR